MNFFLSNDCEHWYIYDDTSEPILYNDLVHLFDNGAIISFSKRWTENKYEKLYDKKMNKHLEIGNLWHFYAPQGPTTFRYVIQILWLAIPPGQSSGFVIKFIFCLNCIFRIWKIHFTISIRVWIQYFGKKKKKLVKIVNWFDIRERREGEGEREPSLRFVCLSQTFIQFTAFQLVNRNRIKLSLPITKTKIVFNEEKLNLSFKFVQRIYHLSIQFHHWPFSVILPSIEICIYVNS